MELGGFVAKLADYTSCYQHSPTYEVDPNPRKKFEKVLSSKVKDWRLTVYELNIIQVGSTSI